MKLFVLPQNANTIRRKSSIVLIYITKRHSFSLECRFTFFISTPSPSHRIPFVQADELRAVVFEKQIDLAGGAVVVFGDDQFRQANGRM